MGLNSTELHYKKRKQLKDENKKLQEELKKAIQTKKISKVRQISNKIHRNKEQRSKQRNKILDKYGRRIIIGTAMTAAAGTLGVALGHKYSNEFRKMQPSLMRNNLNKFINVQSDDQNNDIEYKISKNKDINTNFITDLNELKSKQDINDINQVYKTLVIKYHPDSHIIDKQSHSNVFNILNKVYGDKIKNIHYVEHSKFNINLTDSLQKVKQAETWNTVNDIFENYKNEQIKKIITPNYIELYKKLNDIEFNLRTEQDKNLFKQKEQALLNNLKEEMIKKFGIITFKKHIYYFTASFQHYVQVNILKNTIDVRNIKNIINETPYSRLD